MWLCSLQVAYATVGGTEISYVLLSSHLYLWLSLNKRYTRSCLVDQSPVYQSCFRTIQGLQNPGIHIMDSEVIKILLVGDEKCGKTTFLSYVEFNASIEFLDISY
jgi:hypothetical protein